MAQVSVTANTRDRASLEEARAFIESLLGSGQVTPLATASADDSAGPEPRSEADAIEAYVDDLWQRMGTNLRKMVAESATFDDHWWSLAELADKLGEEMQSTKSRWANLGRSLKAASAAVPYAPPMYTWQKREGLWHFSMAASMRSVVINKAASSS
jgi:hypothetical protein